MERGHDEPVEAVGEHRDDALFDLAEHLWIGRVRRLARHAQHMIGWAVRAGVRVRDRRELGEDVEREGKGVGSVWRKEGLFCAHIELDEDGVGGRRDGDGAVGLGVGVG